MKRFIFLVLGISLLCIGCKKDDTEVTSYAIRGIETLQAINVFHDRATLLAAFDPLLGDVVEKGFFFSDHPFTDNNPGYEFIAEISDTTRYQYRVTGLEKNKAYYVKAYLKKSSGEMIYGRDISFNTDRMEILDPDAPSGSISVPNAKNITINFTSGNLGDQMLSNADKKSTEIKVVAAGLYYWPKTSSEEDAVRFSLDEATAESIEGNTTTEIAVSDLIPDTEYNCRLFIRTGCFRSYGTAYSVEVLGDKQTFVTPAISLASVETGELRPTTTNAILHGKVTDMGMDPDVKAGFYVGLTADALAQRIESDDMDENGTFSVFVKNLSAETTYYIRPFVENEAGENVGEGTQFSTLAMGAPMLNDIAFDYEYRIANMTPSSVCLPCQVLTDGGYALSSYGVYWGTDPSQLTEIYPGQDLDVETGNFRVQISGLEASQIYYYKPFAKNERGEGVGNVLELRMPVYGGKQYCYDESITSGYSFERMIFNDVDLYYYELDPFTVGNTTYYFLDRNLGATKPFDASNYNTPVSNTGDTWEAIGYYYQFGFSVPSATPNITIVGNLNVSHNWTNDKSVGVLDDVWTSSICPDGYDLPTKAQMDEIIAAQTDKTLNGFFQLMRVGPTGVRAGGLGGIGGNVSTVMLWLKDRVINATHTGQGYFFRITPDSDAATGQQGNFQGAPVRCMRIENAR